MTYEVTITQCGSSVVQWFSMTIQCVRSVVQLMVVRVDIGVMIYEAMTPQCGRSVIQVLVVRVDIGVMIYEAMTPQSGRSVVQVLVVRVDKGVVIHEAMTPKCWRSVVQVLVVRVDLGLVICDTPVCEVRVLGPGCQSGFIQTQIKMQVVSQAYGKTIIPKDKQLFRSKTIT